MANLHLMSEAELARYESYCAQAGNLQAAQEVREYLKWHGKQVIVTKGRKVPVETTGKVVYLARKHYGQNQWLGWRTIVGIQDNNGTVHYTNVANIDIVGGDIGE